MRTGARRAGLSAPGRRLGRCLVLGVTSLLVFGVALPAHAEDVVEPAVCPTDGTADPLICPTGPTPEVTATADPTPEVTATADPTPEVTVTADPTPEVTATADPTPEVTATADPTPEVTGGTTFITTSTSPAPAPSQSASSSTIPSATLSPVPLALAAPVVAPAAASAVAPAAPVPSAVLAFASARSFGFPVLAPPSAVGVSTLGWGNPLTGRLTSAFGYRVHPVFNIPSMHSGQDVAARCGAPIHAAAGGVVVWVGGAFQGRTGNQVVVADGNGIVTRYGHLLSGSVLVRSGQAIQAGQQIASVGGDRGIDPLGAGNSTGCHLHFEVNLDDGMTPIDPVVFLSQRGVRLGTDMPFQLVAPAPAAPTIRTSAADLDRIKAIVGVHRPTTAVRFLG